MCLHVNLRGHFKDGIFYIDIKDVEDIEDLSVLLRKQGLMSIFEQNWRSRRDFKNDREILIVYDNADKLIRRSQNHFNWHLHKLRIHSPYLKAIVSSNKLLKTNLNDLNTQVINLEGLD